MKEDTELIASFREGKETAFEEVYKMYGTRIFRFAYGMMGNRAEAEDATQDVFLKAFRWKNTFRGETSLLRWLFIIAKNTCLDRLKKKPSLAHPPASDDPFLKKEEEAEVQTALAQLPVKERTCLLLCDVEGFSYDEIARNLGFSLGAVKTFIHRGRNRLKKFLTRQEHETL